MHHDVKRWLGLTASVLAMAAAPVQAQQAQQAQEWPTRTVRLVAAFPPGTPGDVIARLIQPTLQAGWGQPVVVENRPGAGGNLAAAEVARATDGHTLLVGPDTILTINPHVYRNLPQDLRRELKPVTYFASFNQTLACNPAAEVASLEALAALPPSRTYASGGVGTPSHMAMEMLASAIGSKLTHVPYKGPGPAAQDVLAGHVDCGFIVSSVVLPHLQTGRLKPIAVSSEVRSGLLPGIPTVAESGQPGFDATFFETLMAPAAMPAGVMLKVQRDVGAALAQPDITARLAEMDLRVVANTPEQAAARGATDFARWGTVAAQAGVRLD